MTSLNYLKAALALVNLCVVSFCLIEPLQAQTPNGVDQESVQTVVVTLFTSSHCPYCENVKELVDDLKTEFSIKTEIFDINKPSDYDLYCKIEATHRNTKFAVPLVIVGDNVLIGQSEIFANLEKTVRSLQNSGQTDPLAVKTEPAGNLKTHHKEMHHQVKTSSKKEHDSQPKNEKHTRLNKIKIITDDDN
ncbi:MAG: glutaredoxin [Deltaproteobacteria bacterium]|nr:glutaredoxin [Deltaproteobacteria bacterium]